MLTEAPPFAKGLTNMYSVMKSLPNRNKASEVIAACYTLSRFSKDEVLYIMIYKLTIAERLKIL